MSAHCVPIIGCFALFTTTSLCSVASADPKIPIENQSGRFMKLTAKGPGNKNVEVPLKTGEKKWLDLSTPGFYELRVSDSQNTTAVIGRFDLRQELSKNPKTKIFISSRYAKLANGSRYIGPVGTVGTNSKLLDQ